MPKPQPVDPVTLRGLSVLVVDDNPTNLRNLEAYLKSWQMQPETACGGAAALQVMAKARAEGQPFALVIIDGRMPEMDGFELARRIRQDPSLAGAALMMLSPADLVGARELCRQLGIAAHLLKPVTQSTLLEAIAQALGGAARLAREATQQVAALGAAVVRRRLRILLAEDNALNQRVAARMLSKQGHEVMVAGHGREALAAFEREPFDLIFMDVQMPEMDGLEATAAIRKSEQIRGGHIPIVAMTAHAMKGDREMCLAAGMDGYVSKPLHPAALAEAVEAVLPAVTSPATCVEAQAK